MTVQQEDLTFLQSVMTGSAGGAASGVVMVSGSDNNLWPDISAAEAAAGGTRYRKWFMRNDNPSDTLPDYGIWLAAEAQETEEWMAIGWDSDDDDDPARGDLTQLSGDAIIALVSSSADTRVVTVIGENIVGAPIEENVTLTGTTEALSVVTFSVLHALRVDGEGAQTVTIKEGAGGATVGTIPANSIGTWIWLEPAALSSALKRVAMAPGDIHGFWSKMVWDPASAEVDPNESIIALQRLP